MTDTKGLQNNNKHYIRIKDLKEDPNSKFLNRNRFCYENKFLFFLPKSLIPTIFRKMHDRFGNLTIGKTCSLIEIYYFWPHMLKYISQ